MNKFDILFEEIKDISELLKDCEVEYQPGDSEDPNKCQYCGKDINDKIYKLKNGNVCEKCFNTRIKKRKVNNNDQQI